MLMEYFESVKKMKGGDSQILPSSPETFSFP